MRRRGRFGDGAWDWRVPLAVLLVTVGAAGAADEYKKGWTPATLKEATGACTEALVQGAWENTKKDQKLDPKRELTPGLRKQLAPQIDAFRQLCECTVRETGKKYGREEFLEGSDEVGKYAQDLIKNGVCKPPPQAE